MVNLMSDYDDDSDRKLIKLDDLVPILCIYSGLMIVATIVFLFELMVPQIQRRVAGV